MRNPRILGCMAFHDLLWTYFKANILKPTFKKKLRFKIIHTLKTKHHMPSLVNIIFKVPQNFYHTKKLKRLIHALIKSTTLPNMIKSFIHKKVKIVQTKRKSMQDLICNHIKTSKNFTNKPPKCTCTKLVKLLGQPTIKTNTGHFMMRLSNLPKQYKKLGCNIKNIPICCVEIFTFRRGGII